MKSLFRSIQIGGPVLCAVCSLSLATACGGGYNSPQATWSDMDDAQRSGVRAVMLKFQDGGAQPVNATSINDIIVFEGLRVFSDVYANSHIVISEPELDLTSAEVLPELDAGGAYDPTGGYRSFNEVVHDSAGNPPTDQDIHQPARDFTAGSLNGFGRSFTIDSPTDRFLATTDNESYSIGEAMEYVETAWNQQKTTTRVGTGSEYNENFAYQSSPTRKISLEAGSSYSEESTTQDQILSTEGYDVTAMSVTNWNLTGTYTLYRPTEVTANTNPEAAYTTNTTPSGNITTTTTDETTVIENTVFAGPSSELEKKTVTTTTTTTLNTVDSTTGCTTHDDRTVWTTATSTFTVRDGMIDDERRNRSLEQNPDYTETTKEVTEVPRTCEVNLSYSETTTITAERYTDNPKTRNNVAPRLGANPGGWGSTRKVVTVAYDSVSGTTTTTDYGTEWLTDHVTEDADVSGAKFAITGSDTTSIETHERYFGDNREGVERNTVQSRNLNLSYDWAGTTVIVSGVMTNRGASINAPGTSTAEHATFGDWDGVLSVSVGDASFSVSAEEWSVAVNP